MDEPATDETEDQALISRIEALRRELANLREIAREIYRKALATKAWDDNVLAWNQKLLAQIEAMRARNQLVHAWNRVLQARAEAVWARYW